jgi:predicted type IV restriction endonuclease
MPLNEIPKYLTPEVRSLIEVALEDAWHELLKKDGALQATQTRNKLRRTMVALASVGETDHRKLKWFAIHAWRGTLQAQQSSSAIHARMTGTAP